MSPREMLHLNKIEKNFGEMSALSSLSLTVNKGERLALIGPSGAGKTTLLNILSTTLKADAGEFIIDGKPATHYKSRKLLSRKLGIIRQQFDLIGPLAVIHNVLAGRLGEWGLAKSLTSLLFPQEKEVALRALKRVGLEDKVFERTANLSGGEQQRVAMARLLVQKPEIILADEPVSSLDPARSEDILSMLVKLVKEEDQTLVTSLHSVELAKKFFTRIIAIRNGEVFFDLPTEQVTDQHLNELYQLMELNDNDQ